ncbi:MAG: hypothetical protein ACR2LQ_11080 [Acidimicrobiales bacterium]
MDGLRRWVETKGAIVAAFGMLRVVAMAAGCYLILIATLGAVARRGNFRRLALLVDACTVPSLRSAIGGAGFTTLVVLAGVGAPPAGADPGASQPDRVVELAPQTAPTAAPPTMRAIGANADLTSTTTPTEAATAIEGEPTPTSVAVAAPPATMRRLEVAASSPVPEPAKADETWTIEPGESFWSVAQSHLDETLGRAADDSEVERYWLTLMSSNADASPTGDPNLLYSGTVLVLPPV